MKRISAAAVLAGYVLTIGITAWSIAAQEPAEAATAEIVTMPQPIKVEPTREDNNAEVVQEPISLDEQLAEEAYYGELELLAALVECEAGNQDIKGRMLVACTVLNRMDSEAFPDSITDVIYQPGQFVPAGNGAVEVTDISDESFEAVSRVVLGGERIDTEVLFFCADYYNGSTPLYKYGGHYFSK